MPEHRGLALRIVVLAVVVAQFGSYICVIDVLQPPSSNNGQLELFGHGRLRPAQRRLVEGLLLMLRNVIGDIRVSAIDGVPLLTQCQPVPVARHRRVSRIGVPPGLETLVRRQTSGLSVSAEDMYCSAMSSSRAPALPQHAREHRGVGNS